MEPQSSDEKEQNSNAFKRSVKEVVNLIVPNDGKKMDEFGYRPPPPPPKSSLLPSQPKTSSSKDKKKQK